MKVYHNEFEPFAASWLERLYPTHTIDRRSIAEVQPEDLAGYDQAHFFAGIGGWDYALHLAGWPTDRPVWTGSCPCQPFSVIGRQGGTEDERHLWPEFRRLIAERLPPVVFGEQVASAAGRSWLAGVRADLEALGYAVGAADLCAAGIGAPHIRQRLYWVASRRVADTGPERVRATRSGTAEGTPGDAEGARTERERLRPDAGPSGSASPGGVGDAIRSRLEGHAGDGDEGHQSRWFRTDEAGSVTETGDLGCWSDAEWLPCTDDKARRAQPSSFPLAHGVPSRVGRIRAYGNAIVPPLAAEFIRAFLDTEG